MFNFEWFNGVLHIHELQFDRLAHRDLIASVLTRYFTDFFSRNESRLNGGECLCVVGSVARGEFDIHNSDIDLWFLDTDPKVRNHILRSVRSELRGFDFGLNQSDVKMLRRNSGKSAKKDWKKYPCLDFFDFGGSGLRRAQLLFETHCVYNEDKFAEFQDIALESSQLSPKGRHIRQSPHQIYADIDEYATTTKIPLDSGPLPYAKQLVSRRLSQHLMRLSVIEATFRKEVVNEHPDPSRKFSSILVTPTSMKSLFWASSEFLTGTIMTRISGQEFHSTVPTLHKLLDDQHSTLREVKDARTFVGSLAVLVARDYASALNLLHSSSLRPAILKLQDEPSKDIFKDRNFKQLIDLVQRFESTCKLLVCALEVIFVKYNQARLFSRLYETSGLETAVMYALSGFKNDI